MLVFSAGIAVATPPAVKTVPWVSSNPLIPHTTYSGKAIRLKGTCDRQGSDLHWTWDFGDGSPVATGTVTNKYVIEASHTYTGASGTVYTARLTVHDQSTGETGSNSYFVAIQDRNLEVEVNIAIDEGLWYLHKVQTRSTINGAEVGDWSGSGNANSIYYGLWAANVNAFEVNGHLEVGDPQNPYTETVQRGMRRLFQVLTTHNMSLQALGNPDSNGNGLGVQLNQYYAYYQGGMFMDAIVASGTPNAVTSTGPTNILGRTYRDIIQDMVDDHAWAQYDDAAYGGWRYSAQDFPDNSACQWAAIGLIAAERSWGCTVPAWVKSSNLNWLAYTQDGSGRFGYTSPGYFPWGPYASTPSGMVQMVLNDVGRGMPGVPSWEKSETFLRDNFGNGGGPANGIKTYYYGLFSFVKSMLLHEPAIVLLQSQTPGVLAIDWYAAEVSKGAPTDGVARTLVNDQDAAGYWLGHNFTPEQYPFETAWAIMMLHKTLFESGVPVAVAKAVPNPAVGSQPISLDGSDSYHQDASKHIVSWQWDTNSDGVFDASGPSATTSFAAVGDYLVKLRVGDDSSPARFADTILTVRVTTPPIVPTAAADGPYVFCPDAKPWFLDARNSVNPDEGRSEPHSPPYPGDTIQKYEWDLDGDSQFDDATGPTPDVTAFFVAKGPGSYLISLRVTDTTATAFPSSGQPNLTNTATAQVIVQASSCQCVTLTAAPVGKDISLVWTEYTGAHHYNVYRGTVSGGPYTKVGSSSTLTYLDHPGILNIVYYYVVRPAEANDDEVCQSNQVFAEPLHPGPTVTCTPTVYSNTAKYYYTLGASSSSFGRNQLRIYVRDTGSAQVAGPFGTDWLVYIRTNLPSASVRAGVHPVRAYVMTKGSAKVWAVDPLDQTSAEITIP